MRLYEFLFQIVDKNAPMTEADRTELKQDALVDYGKVRDSFWNKEKKDFLDGFDQKKMTLKQKVVRWSEYWPVRMVLAIAYIWIQPMIHEYMNPSGEDSDYVEVDEYGRPIG